MKKLGLFCIFLFYSIPTTPLPPTRLYVWNVGQGSWATVVNAADCLHIDIGGEYVPDAPLLLRECQEKSNSLILTHLDRDHIRFLAHFQKKLKVCVTGIHTLPQHPLLNRVPECAHSPTHLRLLQKSSFKQKNDSHIYLWNSILLIMGDSYHTAELNLLNKHELQHIRYLLVGHHGSRTSSHPRFVAQLPRLEQAVVSARHKKYGHPHAKTRGVFRQFKKPLIETQSFGTLIFEMD